MVVYSSWYLFMGKYTHSPTDCRMVLFKTWFTWTPTCIIKCRRMSKQPELGNHASEPSHPSESNPFAMRAVRLMQCRSLGLHGCTDPVPGHTYLLLHPQGPSATLPEQGSLHLHNKIVA